MLSATENPHFRHRRSSLGSLAHSIFVLSISRPAVKVRKGIVRNTVWELERRGSPKGGLKVCFHRIFRNAKSELLHDFSFRSSFSSDQLRRSGYIDSTCSLCRHRFGFTADQIDYVSRLISLSFSFSFSSRLSICPDILPTSFPRASSPLIVTIKTQ